MTDLNVAMLRHVTEAVAAAAGDARMERDEDYTAQALAAIGATLRTLDKAGIQLAWPYGDPFGSYCHLRAGELADRIEAAEESPVDLPDGGEQ